MSPLHLRIALSYLIPFTVFFVVMGTVLHGQLRRSGASARRETLTNVGLLVGGFSALPLMTIVAVLSTWFFRRTGHIWVGAFLSAVLVTWIVVASQATHYAF